MKKGLLMLMSVLSGPAHAQYWTDAGLPVDQADQVWDLYVDVENNRLYCTGILVHDWGQPEQSFRMGILENGVWSLSAPLSHFSTSVVNFHDTLYVAGVFTHVGGESIPHLACYSNGTWYSCGSFNNAVMGLRVVDGELYAVGPFTMVDGTPCKGVVKRSGNSWTCIGELNCNTCNIVDIAKIDDRLYITGTITFTGNPYRHVMQYHAGEWTPVGEQGIYGSLSGGVTLAVYQGDLYLGGLILISAGNAGHALMRWDGSAWHQVGAGLQDTNGGMSQSFNVRDLMVHDDKLFVAGGFTYAGNMYSPRLATWDGVEWCSIGGDFGDYPVQALAYYNDTLYSGCLAEADGPVNGVAKFIAPAFQNNCSLSVLAPANEAESVFNLATLGDRHFRISGIEGDRTLRLFNGMGQTVKVIPIQDAKEFSLHDLPAGVYIGELIDVGKVRFLLE